MATSLAGGEGEDACAEGATIPESSMLFQRMKKIESDISPSGTHFPEKNDQSLVAGKKDVVKKQHTTKEDAKMQHIGSSNRSTRLQITSEAGLAAFRKSLLKQKASGGRRQLNGGTYSTYDTASDDTAKVHMCAVATGTVLPEFQALLRSVKKAMADKSNKAEFHILTDESTVGPLQNELKSLGFAGDAQVIDFRRLEGWSDQAKVKQEHHSGLAGFAKLFFFELFSDVKQCVTIDSDLYVVEDPSNLLATFDASTVVSGTWRPRYEFGNKINTGVLIENFERMNQVGPAGITFSDAILQAHALANKFALKGATEAVYIPSWGDQPILHLGLLAYAGNLSKEDKPSGFQTMDVSWNLEMCQDFEGLCSGASRELKIGHFNCGLEEGTQWWKEGKFQSFASCLDSHGVDLSLVPQ